MYVPGRAREDVRRQDVEPRLIFEERRRVEGGDLGRAFALFARLRQHFILTPVHHLLPHMTNIGNILHMEYLEAAIFEGAPDPVGHREGA